MNNRENDLLELDDLVYTYPRQDDPEFQTKITAKKEFNVLASIPNEPIPDRGEFFNWQKLNHRFFNVYPRSLIISSPGTGKSGSVLGFTEKLRSDMLNNVTNFVNDYVTVDKTHIKKVIILVKNKTLKNQIKKEIVCKYSQRGTYESETMIKKETALKSSITRELGRYYDITTYIKFAKNLYERNYSEREMEEEYSNTMFVFDEVHNIRIEYKEKEEDNGIDESVKKERRINEERQQKKIYDTYHKLFHSIKRSKVVLMSATPMINEAKEISRILNLILPLNKQMPTSGKEFSKLTDTELKYYFNGLVSYVAESDTFAVPKYHGEEVIVKTKIGDMEISSKQIVYKMMMYNDIPTQNGMIPGQGRVYSSIPHSTNTTNSFYGKERSACNFITPDGKYGQDVVITREKTMPYSSRGYMNLLPKNGYWMIDEGNEIYTPVPELRPWLQLGTLKYLSVKFNECIDISNKSKGNVFIFCPFKNGSGGAFSLGMCYRENGYEQFSEIESVFKKIDKKGKRYCGESEDNQSMKYTRKDRQLKDGFRKKLRFAIITSNMKPSNKIDTILEIFNSWENRHGEYIKVLLVTPIVREGINTANVLTYITVAPEWNESLSLQARYRVLRAISHRDLLEERTDKNEKLYVDIYNMAAYVEDTNSSIDMHMYKISGLKDISIKYVENIMHSIAYDCQIHYSRNQRKHDDSYVCSGLEPTEIDTSSYDVLYSGSDIDMIVEYVKDLYLNVFNASLTEIIRYVNERKKYPVRYVEQALEKIITEKIMIKDRYGIHGYLQEVGQIYYIVREYPLINKSSNIINNFYSDNLFGTLTNSISDYLDMMNKTANMSLESEILDMNPDTPEWLAKYEQLSDDSKIGLFESSIIEILNGNSTPIYDKIYGLYYKYIYTFYEPLYSLNMVQSGLNVRGTGRGRKPNPNNIPKIKQLKVNGQQLDESMVQNGTFGNEQVYIHSLFKSNEKISSYSASSNIGKSTGRLRIYKKSENQGWRDLSMNEIIVYNILIDELLKKKFDELDKLPIYGIVSNNKFYIRDKLNERSAGSKNKRTIKRGRVASTYDVAILVSFYWITQLPLPKNELDKYMMVNAYEKMNYLRMRNVDIQKEGFDENKLNYYYTLYVLNYGREKMAEMLKNRLTELGWIYIE